MYQGSIRPLMSPMKFNEAMKAMIQGLLSAADLDGSPLIPLSTYQEKFTAPVRMHQQGLKLTHQDCSLQIPVTAAQWALHLEAS